MDLNRVVDIRLPETRAYGSGYLITNRLVLTAKHVAGASGPGVRCQITPLQIRGAPTGQAYDASVAWVSPNSDAALLQTDRAVPGLLPGSVVFGRLPLNAGPRKCRAIGFPDAQGGSDFNEDRQLAGELTWVLRDNRFNLDVGNAEPEHADNWRGFSGAAVFTDHLLGLVRSYDERWGGRVLEVIPAELLFADESFCRLVSPIGNPSDLLVEDGPRVEDDAGVRGKTTLPPFPARLRPYLADRVRQEAIILDYIDKVFTAQVRRPGVFLLHGSMDQCVDTFTDRIRDHTLPAALKRASISDRIKHAPIDWPPTMPDGSPPRTTDELELELRESLFKRLQTPLGGEKVDVVEKLKEYDAALIPCELQVYDWGKEDVALLRAWLAWWQAFPDAAEAKPVLIIFYVPYHLGWPWGPLLWPRIRAALSSMQAEILAAGTGGRLIGSIVPQLGSIALPDAMSWANDNLSNISSDEVRRRLHPKFTRFFGLTQRLLPMQAAVDEFVQLLEQDKSEKR
jgi:hypothetical protein